MHRIPHDVLKYIILPMLTKKDILNLCYASRSFARILFSPSLEQFWPTDLCQPDYLTVFEAEKFFAHLAPFLKSLICCKAHPTLRDTCNSFMLYHPNNVFPDGESKEVHGYGNFPASLMPRFLALCQLEQLKIWIPYMGISYGNFSYMKHLKRLDIVSRPTLHQRAVASKTLRQIGKCALELQELSVCHDGLLDCKWFESLESLHVECGAAGSTLEGSAELLSFSCKGFDSSVVCKVLRSSPKLRILDLGRRSMSWEGFEEIQQVVLTEFEDLKFKVILERKPMERKKKFDIVEDILDGEFNYFDEHSGSRVVCMHCNLFIWSCCINDHYDVCTEKPFPCPVCREMLPNRFLFSSHRCWETRCCYCENIIKMKEYSSHLMECHVNPVAQVKLGWTVEIPEMPGKTCNGCKEEIREGHTCPRVKVL